MTTHLDCMQARKELNEKDDCTIRAAACALDLPYKEVHSLAAQHGRNRRACMWPLFQKPDHRCSWPAMYNVALNRTGKTVINVTAWHKGRTIRTRLRQLNPNATYLILIHGHIFCYRQGEILDQVTKLSLDKVIRVWMVVNRPKKV